MGPYNRYQVIITRSRKGEEKRVGMEGEGPSRQVPIIKNNLSSRITRPPASITAQTTFFHAPHLCHFYTTSIQNIFMPLLLPDTTIKIVLFFVTFFITICAASMLVTKHI